MSTTNPYAARPANEPLKVETPVEVVVEKISSVPSGTVPEVLAWVDGDVDRALEALEAELDGAKRKSLIATLEGIIG